MPVVDHSVAASVELPGPGSTSSSPTKLRRLQHVEYKEIEGRKWRAAVVISLAHNGVGVKILFHNGKSICDLETKVHLLRAPSKEQDEEHSAHWLALDKYVASKSRSADAIVGHEPLYKFLQRQNYKANLIGRGQLRLMTWNVKHFGAMNRMRTHDPAEREQLLAQRAVHDDERARNIAEVIYLSRCAVVVLQEVARSADIAGLCRLLEERSERDGGTAQWRGTAVVGEHAMLYCIQSLAATLGCSTASLSVEAGLYDRSQTLSPAFQAATDWQSVSSRFDFGMQGASAARLPAFFFAHGGGGDEGGRSLAVCSVHLAFGVGGKSDTRTRQLDNLKSLMPGAAYDPSSCLFALLGDFNSNASIAERGFDFASSDVGKAVISKLNGATPGRGYVAALPANKKTSIGGSGMTRSSSTATH